MAKVLRFRTNTLIQVNDVNGTVDVDAVGSLHSDKDNIDLAIEGFADFISGNYIQNVNDTNEVKSNVTIDANAVNAAIFRLVTATNNIEGGDMTFTTYGNTIRSQDAKLLLTGINGIRNGSITYNTINGSYFGDLEAYDGNVSNLRNNNSILRGKGGLGPVLVQSVSAALFKSLGRNAAINNDTDVASKSNGLAISIKDEWDESNGNSTKYFTRYLDSGRFYDDMNTGTVDSKVDYNFANATFDFIVKLTGSVSDSDTGINMNSDSVNRIFGDKTNTETKVNSTGAYTMNIYVRLTQKNGL